jgi:hypothetical protein
MELVTRSDPNAPKVFLTEMRFTGGTVVDNYLEWTKNNNDGDEVKIYQRHMKKIDVSLLSHEHA